MLRPAVRLATGLMLAALWACAAHGPGHPLTPEKRVEAAIARRAGSPAPATEPLTLDSTHERAALEQGHTDDPPQPTPSPTTPDQPDPAALAPPQPDPSPTPDARASDHAARAQLRNAGLAVISLTGTPDAAVAAALARNSDLWRRLEDLGVSASRLASRWTPDGNEARPERRLAELVESLATPRHAREARQAVDDLARHVRTAYLRLQAASRALDLQSTHVRSFQAATALSRAEQAVTDHAGERAAAQRARLELVRLQTEVSSLRRELELLMGFPAGAPPWTPVPGPPPLPHARHDPRLEDAIAQALAARPELASLRAGPHPDARAHAAELELALRAHVIDAHARLTTARLVAEACRDALIPMHERIVELALDRFRAGSLDAPALLAAQRELVTARRQEIESLRDYWIARLDLRHAAEP